MEQSWPKGMKHTKQREDVYGVLLNANGPLTAVDIYRRVPGYALSTVYRTLLAFEECNMVTKSSLLGEDTAVYELNCGAHRHYAVCLQCRERIPLKSCPFDDMDIQMQEGFTVTGHKIEIYGYCRKCSANRTEVSCESNCINL